MTRSLHTSVLLLILLFSAMSYGEVFETRQFDNSEQSARYKKMTAELRCLVCQNQNIADSNADLAKDLRDKTYEMIMSGKTDAEIIDYMVARYGDFVLYNPPLKSSTIVLWLGPFLVMLISLGLLLRYILRRRQQQVTRPTLSEEQRSAAAKLLATKTAP